MNKPDNSILSLLREVEIFTGFEESILEEFAKNMVEVNLKKDEILFKKGDKECAMFIIIDGSVQVHDQDYIFTTLNNKQFFGEYSLIDSAVRSATVTAVRDSKLLELTQFTFEKATQKRPELWKSVLVALIKRLRDYNILEEKLTMRTLEIQKKRIMIEKEMENISAQKKELEAINYNKDKFFTIIANDLKYPFNTVINISDDLLKKYDTYDKSKIVEKIDHINQHTKNAHNLLENLLTWAKSQTGAMKIVFKRANISSIIDEVICLNLVNAQLKGITIEKNVDSKLHGYFDVDMVTTVLRNLVTNALRNSPVNSKIEIAVIESGDMISLKVVDQGKGIDINSLDNMFRIEVNQNTKEDEMNQGLHFELIICKEFVLKNGGKIWVENNADSGVSFCFTLPKAL